MKLLTTLVEHLIEKGVLKTPEIIQAFRTVDRKDFVPPQYQEEAYADHAIPITAGQTTSQPYTVAFMLELLEPRESERILDVGTGSGWTTALLAHIVGVKGKVWGVEIIPELVALGKKNIAKYMFKHAEIREAGKELGLPEHAPFDKILVSADALQLVEELTMQLKVGGVMVIPIQNAIWKVTRTSEKETEIERFEGFVFVPLIH